MRNTSVLLAPMLHRFLCYCAIFLKISLITHHYEGEVIGFDTSIIDESLSPVVKLLKALLISDIVDQGAAIGSSVECK